MPKKLPALRAVSDLSETTLASYNRCINTLRTRGIDTLNLDAVKTYLSDFAISSRKFILSAIIHMYRDKAEHAKYLTTLREYNLSLIPMLEKEKEEQTMNDKEKQKHVPWEEVVRKSMKFLGDEENRLDHRILVGLYVLLDPVRVDYTNMKLYREEPKDVTGTYFVINKAIQEVVITEYKTSKVWGRINQKLPKLLSDMIEEWFKMFDVLFDMSENYMSRVVKKLFTEITGKPMTVTALRHSRISFHHSEAPPPVSNKILARNMGHSVGTQQSYRFADA